MRTVLHKLYCLIWQRSLNTKQRCWSTSVHVILTSCSVLLGDFTLCWYVLSQYAQRCCCYQLHVPRTRTSYGDWWLQCGTIKFTCSCCHLTCHLDSFENILKYHFKTICVSISGLAISLLVNYVTINNNNNNIYGRYHKKANATQSQCPSCPIEAKCQHDYSVKYRKLVYW